MGPGEKEKELVVGVTIDGQSNAYPIRLIKKLARISDKLAGRKLALRFNVETESLTVIDAQGKAIEQMTVYWFVWIAIWPETDLYKTD